MRNATPTVLFSAMHEKTTVMLQSHGTCIKGRKNLYVCTVCLCPQNFCPFCKSTRLIHLCHRFFFCKNLQ